MSKTPRKSVPARQSKAKPTTKPTPRARRPRPDRSRFALEYLIDRNAHQAALRCGYSPKSAHSQGARLLKDVEIAAQIATAMEERAERTKIKADDVLRELAILGLSDMRNYVSFGADGDLALDWSHMPEEATRAISEVTQEVIWQSNGDGDPIPVRKTKFKLHGKVPALNLIAQHLGMLVNRHEHTGKDGAPLPPAVVLLPAESSD